MWPPSEWEIRAALEHATPQQRQQVIQGGGKPSEVATRLNMAENITRQKLNTPPPPQGTVMNQYYQWPQQADDMGLGQPGLEELAQQYASGGLVAFEEGGPVRGFTEGSDVRLHEYPWHVLGEGIDPSVIDEDTYRKIYEDLPSVGEGDRPPREWSADETAGMSNDEPWPFNPSAIQHPGFDKGRSYLSEAGDYIGDAFTSLREKIASLEGADDPYGFALAREFGSPNEDDKIKEQIAEKSAKQQAEVDEKERPGMSALSPETWSRAGLPSMLAQYEGGEGVPRANGLRTADESAVNESQQPTIVIKKDGEPVERTTGESSSKVPKVTFADRVELAKQYLGIDTTKAMDFVSAMEKRAAHEGNMGMISAIASAAGLGLGAYGSGSHRWGTALAGLASGMMGAAERESQAMDKIDAAKLKLAEEEGRAEKEAFKYVTDKEVAAAAKAAEWQHELELARMEGDYKVNAAAAGSANKGAITPAKLADLRQKAVADAKEYEGTKWSLLSPEAKDQRIESLFQQYLRGYGDTSSTASSSPATPTYQSKLGVTYRPPVS